MRRVPSFLPNTINTTPKVTSGPLGGAVRTGESLYTQQWNSIVTPTQMLLVVFQSPALIDGLLMTELPSGSRHETEYSFFGYRCVGCEKIYLVHSRVREDHDLWEFTKHQCDPSELRRSVRNARHLALERGEYVMENSKGEWFPEHRR